MPSFHPLRWIAVFILVAPTLLRAQVYVQDSPAAAELLNAAEDRMGKDELAEAVRLVQQVLDEHGDKLLERKDAPGSGYTEARRVAARLLMSDEKTLALYRSLQEPLAARALAQANGDRAALAAVADRYGLTDSGLKAALQLAGVELEGGEADSAIIRLGRINGHPGLFTQRVLWQRLVAISAVVAGDSAHAAEAKAALQELNAAAAVKEVDRLTQSLSRPATERPLDPLDVLPTAQPPTGVTKPLWTLAAGGAERFLVDVYKADEHQIEEQAKAGRFLNSLPYMCGGVLYVNDGQTVFAIEPSAGKELWRKQVMEASENFRRFRPYNLPFGVDLNCLAATRQRVVAVMGFGAMVTMYPYYRSDAESQLACLDASDGSTAWLVSPEQVSADLKEAFFYGRPVVSQGRVYVTVRRRQRTQFQDAYIVAMDLNSGKMIWKRHLASTAMSDRQTVPSMAHMTLTDGWIYVDSRLGTVTKLSAADGAVEWVSVAPVDDDVRAQPQGKPWHVSAPVVTPAGVVVLDDWAVTIRVFDAATGAVTSSLPAEQWGNPDLITGFNGDVLAIGDKLGRYDGKTLKAVWVRDLEQPVTGRPAVTANLMYVPAGEMVTLLDMATGEPRGSLPIELPANLLAIEGQVLAAQRQGLASYSTWAVASEQLARRVALNPDDPRPLMALAWLAHKSGNGKTLLETLDKAIALASKPKERDEALADALFEQILAMANDAESADEALRSQLFDRLASVTAGPDHEVTYHLSLARFLEATKRTAEAVERYQTILAEPNYRRRLYTHDSGSRQAGLEAQRLLQALLDKQGRQFYAPYEAFAVKRLEELSGQADPAPLIELAEAYPLATVTPKALQVAAERTAQQNRLREAVALLRRAAQLTKDPAATAEIYGRQAEMFEQAGQPHRARRVLRGLMAVQPDAMVTRGGKPIAPAEWLAALASMPQGGAINARINPPLDANGKLLDGVLLEPIAQDPEATPTGDIVLRMRDRIELRSAADLSALWSRPIEAEEVQLLSIDRTRMWLYYPMSQRVQLIDPADGSVRWEEAGLKQKLNDGKGEDAAAGGAPGEQQPGEVRIVAGPGGQGGRVVILRGGQLRIEGNVQIRGQLRIDGNLIQLDGNQLRPNGPGDTMIGVSDVALALASTDGRVVVLNPDGGKVRWQSSTVVKRATKMLVDSQHLIISGTDEDDAALIGIYDVQTGVLQHRLINPKRQNVLWMGLTDEGLLVYVSTTQVEAFDLNRGRSMWISRPGVQMMGAEASWLGPERLVVRTQDQDLLWIDLADGQVVQRLAVRGSIQGQVTAVFDADQWFIVGSNRCMGTDAAGKVLWRDAIVDGGPILDMAVTDRFVVMLTASQEGSGDPRVRRLYLLDRQGGAVAYQHTVEAPSLMDSLTVRDGKLLISGQALTAVVGGR